MQHTKSILTVYVSLVILIKFQGLRKALIIDLKKFTRLSEIVYYNWFKFHLKL